MKKIIKAARFRAALIAVVLLAALMLIAIGCGDSTTTGTTASTSGAAASGGKVYVAVTGAGELEAGGGNMGFAVVDLTTRKVEMVNLTESRAPHGIMFSDTTPTAPGTEGRVATEMPKTLLLGNAQDGSVNVIDATTRKVTRTIMPPADASLAICGMSRGPDGHIYLTSMGDGKVYKFDEAAGRITDTGVGGGTITQSICGINWSLDGRTAYLGNMYNPEDATQGGYVAVVEWPGGNLVRKIENVTSPSAAGSPAPMAHQTAITPDGRYLYVTDGIDGAVAKVDLAAGTSRKIPVGREPHSIVISADGRTAYIVVRHEPVENQSSIFVYDVEKDKVTVRIAGIPAPLACGIIFSS